MTRIKDTDGDGRADVFETVSDGWEINGDYHEYAFGSKFDKDGNLWVVLCLTGSFTSDQKYRGWCLRITPDGKVIPTCSGIRSPGGIGTNAAGDMFYTDNQGPWNGTCSLKHLEPGSFQGHPGGNRWYELTSGVIGERPEEPHSGSRMMVEAKKIPQLEPPAVYFPYPKMGQSAAGIACDTTGGKFGPFEDQLFVGDQTHSTVMRVSLEKVKGHYQGACFPFRQGFGSGSAVASDDEGRLAVRRRHQPRLGLARQQALFAGAPGLDRQDAVRSPRNARQARRLRADLHPARRPRDCRRSRSRTHSATYTYIYQADYGSPRSTRPSRRSPRPRSPPTARASGSTIDGCRKGTSTNCTSTGVRSHGQAAAAAQQAYYTLNYLPE